MASVVADYLFVGCLFHTTVIIMVN